MGHRYWAGMGTRCSKLHCFDSQEKMHHLESVTEIVMVVELNSYVHNLNGLPFQRPEEVDGDGWVTRIGFVSLLKLLD